jgi:hypothetical protein
MAVSVWTELPVSKDLDAYRKRVTAGIDSVLKQPTAAPYRAYVGAPAVKDPITGVQQGPIVRIPGEVALFPSRRMEPNLYTRVSRVSVAVMVYHRDTNGPKWTQPSRIADDADLSFMVLRSVSDGPGSFGIQLDYDVATTALQLSAVGMTVEDATWRTTGKVTALPHLLGATLVFQVASQPPDESREIYDLPIRTFTWQVSMRVVKIID